MLTIHNIETIRAYSNVNIAIEEITWAYVFWIDNVYGHGPYKVTLSRIHPPQTNHPHRDSYCMTFDNQQMWLQRNDVMDCQKFLITMTHFMANII